MTVKLLLNKKKGRILITFNEIIADMLSNEKT